MEKVLYNHKHHHLFELLEAMDYQNYQAFMHDENGPEGALPEDCSSDSQKLTSFDLNNLNYLKYIHFNNYYSPELELENGDSE